MRTPLLLLVVTAIVLAIIVGAEQPVAAGIVTPPAAESGNTPVIRALQRPSRAEFALSAAPRDPFFARDRAPLAANASAPRTPTAAAPSFPAYRILGKQQNDEGWSVFISSPGNEGQVWVVREGEAFDEHFRVSKLAPPVLIVKNTRNSQIRTFDIGTDEE
jgi:hypothetical protein